MKRFNINKNIGVKLTKKGRIVLREKYPIRVEPDENGYYFLQMWEIMGIFGEFFQCLGKNEYFENDILIKDEDLE